MERKKQFLYFLHKDIWKNKRKFLKNIDFWKNGSV